MSRRGFFKSNLSTHVTSGAVMSGGDEAVTETAPARGQGPHGESAAHGGGDEGKKNGAEGADESAGGTVAEKGKTMVEVYDDVSVCNCLGIRRRALNDARTAKTRGVDWDCVEMQAGMTWKWVNEYAMKNGIVPHFANSPLRLVKPDNGVTSVRLVGMTPRPDVCIVERLADGQREYARVRNMLEWPIHLRECFDCVRTQNLEWCAKWNSIKY